MNDLNALVATQLRHPVPPEIRSAGKMLARTLGGDIVLFYGSVLRTGDLGAILDFYVLRAAPPRRLRDLLWPDVSYHELDIGGRTIRAKVATMALATFQRAARGATIDTTIWSRFAQPARLVIAASPALSDQLVEAVADCVRTAARYAAALGPRSGDACDYWLALFDQSFRAELRIERRGRSRTILAAAPAYYDSTLHCAWRDLGLIGRDEGRPGEAISCRPVMSGALRLKLRAQWRLLSAAGKLLALLRLLKAAWTFKGAARYALGKIERHRGIRIALTPWRERHPILAALGVLFRLWRHTTR